MIHCPACNKIIPVIGKNDCCRHIVGKYIVRYYDEPIETAVITYSDDGYYRTFFRLNKIILLATKERIENIALLK